MAIVPAFYTSNKEEHPFWHDNDQCNEGKKILKENMLFGEVGDKCPVCTKLDSMINNATTKSLWK